MLRSFFWYQSRSHATGARVTGTCSIKVATIITCTCAIALPTDVLLHALSVLVVLALIPLCVPVAFVGLVVWQQSQSCVSVLALAPCV